jgi:hypothetical protein
MHRNLKIVFIIFGGLLIFGAGITLLIMNLLQLPIYVDRVIANDVKVNNVWTELTPSALMKIKRQYQAVSLAIDGAKFNGKSHQLLLKDGTPIRPEVQISDTKGNWYDLKGGSYGASNYDLNTDTFDADIASFEARDLNLPTSTEFRTIRIRSDQPFTCKTVIWRNYNMK